MRALTLLTLTPFLLVACGAGEYDEATEPEPAPQQQGVQLTVEPPAALEAPEAVPVSSESDWEARVHNKEIEIIGVLNILNPVAAYITEGFNQYGDRFSPILHEEWTDTQEQLSKALELYDSCKARKADGAFDKQLFLDMEEVWQLLVKTGVAGTRTKSMVDDELRRMTSA